MNDLKETQSESGIGAQIAVYTASAAAGLLSAWASVRESFGRGIRNADWYKEIIKKRSVEFATKAHLTGKEYVEAHIKIKNDYTQIIADKVKEKGFTNSYIKFLTLTKGQKIRVAGIFATVLTTAVGATTLFRQNHHIRQQLKEMKNKDETVVSQVGR